MAAVPYQYQETANNMGTLISAIPAAINPNLNSTFYIEWYSNHTARTKRNSEYTNFGNWMQRV
jgi:hypothetical protein